MPAAAWRRHSVLANGSPSANAELTGWSPEAVVHVAALIPRALAVLPSTFPGNASTTGTAQIACGPTVVVLDGCAPVSTRLALVTAWTGGWFPARLTAAALALHVRLTLPTLVVGPSPAEARVDIPARAPSPSSAPSPSPRPLLGDGDHSYFGDMFLHRDHSGAQASDGHQSATGSAASQLLPRLAEAESATTVAVADAVTALLSTYTWLVENDLVDPAVVDLASTVAFATAEPPVPRAWRTLVRALARRKAGTVLAQLQVCGRASALVMAFVPRPGGGGVHGRWCVSASLHFPSCLTRCTLSWKLPGTRARAAAWARACLSRHS